MFSLNDLRERNHGAYVAFVEMESGAWNVQIGEIAPIDPASPHFYESNGELYFRDAESDELVFLDAQWTH